MISGTEIRSVVYGSPGVAASTFQQTHLERLAFPDVLARLRKSIEAADMWILHEIDPQALLAKDGYRIGPARQILFFHPRLMARLLATDSAAVLEAPLKFAVLELADGTVMVSWNNPTGALARYQNAALTALGEELSRVCQAIAEDFHG